MGFEINKTELVWPGKYDENGNRREVERVSLPFQVIERVNESRATREAEKIRLPSLFDVWQGDSAETFEDGWRNKLIWGDNKLVMSSLLDQFAGKIDLIYIDPPFAVGADFSVKVKIGDENLEVEKAQSMVEEKAYRDTWGKGQDTYLSMIYERLQLVHLLLRAGGSLFLHLDWRATSVARLLLDEIFGSESLRNEIVWCYYGPSSPGQVHFNRKHDTIWWFTKQGADHVFDRDNARLPYHATTEAKFESEGTGFGGEAPDFSKGKIAEDWWSDIPIAARTRTELTGYPTQKPEKLLTRIISSCSREGDLVADFFSGSGTTISVAEKLGRRWIGADLGRFAIHTARKRLLDIEECRPFEVLNLGKYERKYWAVSSFGEDLDGDGVITLHEYVAFILKLYGAKPTSGLQHLHGQQGKAYVHVGAVDSPVTIDEINAAVDEAVALKAKEVHILGWEWEMGLHDPMVEIAKRKGINLLLRQIPREVMERQAAEKGDVQFFELSYLDFEIKASKKGTYQVVLKNFMIPNPELIPDEVRDKVSKWSDYVDYWAVDWNFSDDSFMQEWVTYRTRNDRSLELKSDSKELAPGKYAVMVKVIDIFGIDTSKVVELVVG